MRWFVYVSPILVLASSGCMAETDVVDVGEELLEIGEGEVVVTFNAALGELPEGVETDRAGNLYVSIAPYAQVRRIAPDGSQTVIAQLDTPFSFPGVGTLGLRMDHGGRLWIANATLTPASNGVWRIGTDGVATRIAGTEGMLFANAIAFDGEGNAYVTETVNGAVWRITPTDEVSVWVQDPLLFGTGELPDPAFPLPLGANGIAIRANHAFVANTEQGTIVRIRINEDGSAGSRSVVVSGLKYLDGLAVDALGYLYAAMLNFVPESQQVLRIAPDGTTVTVAGLDDALDEPTSVAFGKGADRNNLYISNFAFFATGVDAGPSIVRVDCGTNGI